SGGGGGGDGDVWRRDKRRGARAGRHRRRARVRGVRVRGGGAVRAGVPPRLLPRARLALAGLAAVLSLLTDQIDQHACSPEQTPSGRPWNRSAVSCSSFVWIQLAA
uniref:Uncharacterized protein n=1 Tax=Oryza brachyantha TaxID=4533 RepID=J3NEA2_ORYBR